jgi:parallel beta-helix repeat protein
MKTFVRRVTLVVGLVALATGGVQATDISGTIATTLTMNEDSRLVGDVTCTISGAACIQFSAPSLTLQLNGHTITGQGSPDRCPSGVLFGEDGIHTNGQAGVSIVGPGLVRRFREHGILVNGDHSAVRQVVVASSCVTGIAVFGRDNRVEQNTVVGAALVGPGFAGIFCGGDGGHRLRHNEVVRGGGPGITVAPASGSSARPNLLEENSASGNDGIGLLLTLGAIGNTVRRNVVLGNRQSSDMLDGNPAGMNRYEANLCETSLGGAPSCPNLPTISGHADPTGTDGGD